MFKLYKVLLFLRKKIIFVLNSILIFYFGVVCEMKMSNFEGILTLRANRKRSISIGINCEFRSGKAYNIIGGDSRLILRTINEGKIEIGDDVGISNSAIISQHHIIIEDGVMIGGGCKIWDTDFHSLDSKKRKMYPDTDVKTERIRIKSGAFIGGNCLILKGVEIGENAIVGAGSTVTKFIPKNEIWAGNPAKFIRKCS